MEETKGKIRVYNRSNTTVFYVDEETHRTRVWEPAQLNKNSFKDLDFAEIERQVNTRGGRVLFEDYLLIQDKDVCEELEIPCPKEYFYKLEDLKRILEVGTIDECKDLLENCLEGQIDTIQQLCVELRLDSTKKRELVKQYLQFDVNFAIDNEVKFEHSLIK